MLPLCFSGLAMGYSQLGTSQMMMPEHLDRQTAGSGPHSARCLNAIVCVECFVSVTRVYVVGWEEHVYSIGVEIRGHLSGVGSSYHVITGD